MGSVKPSGRALEAVALEYLDGGVVRYPVLGEGARVDMTHLRVDLVEVGGERSARIATAVLWTALTAKQAAVLELLLAGDARRTIAAKMGASEQTVKNVLTDLYRIYDVGSAVELVGLLWSARVRQLEDQIADLTARAAQEDAPCQPSDD